MTPALSVLVPAYNAAATLPRLLEACCALEPVTGGYELLLVDNASTDDTAAVGCAFASRLPLCRLCCTTRGTNRAFNTAVAVATGDLIVTTGADTIPAPDWLTAFLELAKAHPTVSVFGGRIVPLWPSALPTWMQGVNQAVAFARHPDWLEDGCANPQMIWSGNMAVRRDVFDAGFLFDESLGPKPGPYQMGGDTEWTRRVAKAGYRCFFSNRPAVQHIIRPEQLTPAWIEWRGHRYGRPLCQPSA